MPAWAIVLIVFGALVLVLFAGGAAATARRHRVRAGSFRARLEEADRALAAARAEDRGWDPDRLEAAARAAHARAHPGAAPVRVDLVQVVDRPGTEHDRARFRILDDRRGSHEILLGRHGDEWVEVAEG